MSPPQRKLLIALAALYVVLVACAVVLFVLGLVTFGAILTAAIVVGIVGMAKLQRLFRRSSIG